MREILGKWKDYLKRWKAKPPCINRVFLTTKNVPLKMTR